MCFARKGSVKGNYSNKEYWDSRYSENVAADATKADRDTAKINLKSSHISSNTYEWYLDFNKYSQLLMQDIPKASSKPVLVPGCGNSTMCEDLYDLGNILQLGPP